MKDTIMNEKTDVREDNMTEDKRRKKKIIAVIIAVILILGAVIAFLIYNNAITAVTMRIQRLVGTVNLYDEEGAEQSLREKMRLGAGQTVTTAGQSLIMVSLDETKLMTMEETSKAEIKTRGKKLLFNLLEGNLFFNVTEKLADNESFDVTTTTMVCGIRGTSAYVGRDATSHEILMVTDGVVHVVATNPVTQETTEVDVPSGQMITIYLDEEAEGNKTISIVMKSFKEEDLPAMALDAMRKNKALMDRVAKATGFSPKKLATLADLSSTKGVSMYGEAVDDLKAEGVEDAIPFMGDRANEMTTSANSALNIAKDDLPLEVAIIQGYRDVMDVGVESGYDGANLRQLMDGTRGTMEDTFVLIDKAGVRSLDRINVATRVSNTLKVSAGRMSRAKLSTDEIGQVMEAEKTLITGAVRDSAGTTTDGSKGSDILASLDKVGKHITGTVDDEMNKSSDGEETVIALLGQGRKSSADDSDTDEAKQKDTTTAAVPEDTVAAANADTAAANAGNANNMAAGSTQKSEGAATSAEIRNARAAIAVTDPNTGIVALADGTLFDPTYYAAANPDVVARYGTATDALVAQWLAEGKAQGRPPIAPQPAPTQAPVWVAQNDQTQSNEPDPYGDDEDDDDDEEEEKPKQSSSSGSGGNNSPGVTDNGNGTYTLSGAAGNAIVSINANSVLGIIGDHSSVRLPLTINGTTFDSLSRVDIGNMGDSNTASISYSGGTITEAWGKNTTGFGPVDTIIYRSSTSSDPSVSYVNMMEGSTDVRLSGRQGSYGPTDPDPLTINK
ncbi:MAG: FecR domain-containing protein [Lachnospiraceae bacterium]|nr:FecR domain-containing protein [Lachnospiraceae bacterium]